MTLFGGLIFVSANQISSIWLNPRLWYNYFRFEKMNVRHIGILLPVSISTMSPSSAYDSALRCQISSKSDHPSLIYDFSTDFQSPTAPFYFHIRTGWRRSLQNVSRYQQTKFVSKRNTTPDFRITDDGPRQNFGLLQRFVFFCPAIRLIRTIERRFQPFMHTLICIFCFFSIFS